MSSRKNKQHMSNVEIKSDYLHSLQKLIILHLAKNEPQTINQSVEAISKSYKPSWIAFNSLENRKLIAKVDLKNYRGRDYPRYWLTDEGIIMALMEGADSGKLLEQTKIVFPEAKNTHCFLEIMPLFDTIFIKMAYSNVKGKGKLSFSDVAKLILSGAATPIEIETAQKISFILKKYPDQYAQLKIVTELARKNLDTLVSEDS
jgi:hypothetical protein